MKIRLNDGKEGWIKANNLSLEAVDIATAKFSKIALENEDEEKKKAAIREIIQNSDLKSSIFIANLQEMVAEPAIDEIEEELISEYTYDTDSL